MANVHKLENFILKWEGRWANDPADTGGATNMGVTLATWRAYGYDKDGDGDIDEDDLRLITEEDAIERILKPYFWDAFLADSISNQSVANICVDWGWGSGTKKAIRKVQRLLGVTVDGIVGRQTLAAINNADQRDLFNRIKAARLAFVEAVAKNEPQKKKFLRGWKNRINDLTFEA